MFTNFERYDKLISELKIKNINIKINSIFHFDFYVKMMHESDIDIIKCYDNRLFFDYKEPPTTYQDLDISVENISIIYKGLHGFYISFHLEITDQKEIYTYNASEKNMEIFLLNTINNGAIIY